MKTINNYALGIGERIELVDGLWLERDMRGYTLNDDNTSVRIDGSVDLNAEINAWKAATENS